MSITGPGCHECNYTGRTKFDGTQPEAPDDLLELIPCGNCSPWNQPDPEQHQEQVEPIPNSLPFIKDLVISDMQYRAEVGKARYKTYLQPFNGRDVLRDAYEEALDLCIYLRQAMYEKDGK